MKLEPGYAVTPNIRLLRKLGEGGMGSVWVAEHTTLFTEVAVKFIHEELASDTALKRFSREASLAAQIKSPHVVQTFDHGATQGGMPYIVMELLQGESLAVRLSRGPLPARQLGMLVSQVSKALTKAHALGIVHRDLKPANLYLVESGYELFVKVLDFGIAKVVGAMGAGTKAITEELTGASTVIGTPYYMSPEGLRASAELDHRADVWSLAVVAYHALTGALPFKGDSLGDQMALVLEERFTPPSDRVHCGEALDAWFARAFSRHIEDRFQTADELARGFREALRQGGASEASFDEHVVISVPEDGLATSSPTSSAENARTEPASDKAPGDELGTEDETLTADGAASDSSRAADTSSTKESTLQGATTAGSREALGGSRLPLLAGAAVLVGLIGYFALRGEGETEARRSVTAATTAQSAASPAASPTLDPEPSVSTPPRATEAPVEPAPATVLLTIDSVPPRVDVARGDESLGSAPGPFKLPRTDDEVELTFSARGYLSRTKKVRPTKDQTLAVRLARIRTQPEQVEW